MYLLSLTLLLLSSGARVNAEDVHSTYRKTKSCDSQTEASSLSYAVDTTGSMSDDLQALKVGNSWLLDRVTSRLPCGVRQYTMVEFNDPDVGPVRITESIVDFDMFFNSLVATGGGDCPELAVSGIELALINSPPRSFILVLTDASAKDYNNAALVQRTRSLISATKSQIYFLITGLCSGLDDPAFLMYRELASLSFGHIFQVSLSDLSKVFYYLDFTLSRPVNSSQHLFSGDFTIYDHSSNFTVTADFAEFIVTTDGLIYSFQIIGPDSRVVEMTTMISEIWGSMHVVKKPPKGLWVIHINAGGPHSVRVEGFEAVNISPTKDCSECHVNAMCEESSGSLSCTCKDGFIGDGFTCSDIDECIYSWSNKCPVDTCENTFGSYTCRCPSGYHVTAEKTCNDINECSNPELNECHPQATCTNLPGSYACACPPGVSGDGFFCDVDHCSKENVCGIGMECIQFHGYFNCSDPCSNHTVLNEPWRGSTETGSSDLHCDSDKQGWYRFVGNGGVRMPETCVPKFSCGTHAPMWLRGSHPLLNEGIVNHTACAHWDRDCCKWPSDVQVKFCPGGYHVYKFSGTPACSLAYCTDPDSADESCASDEQWVLEHGMSGCRCKDEYAVSGVAHIRPALTCGSRDMGATFQKCQFKDLNVHSLTLKDSSCFGFRDDNVTSQFSIISPLQAGKCGTKLIKNISHVAYANTLLLSLRIGDSIISRTEELNVAISCTYKLDMMVSLNIALQPVVGSTNVTIGGTGQFTAYMALYKDSSYTEPYEGPEVVLSVRTILYIGVFVDVGDPSQYALVLKNCYATPTTSPEDSVKYYLIRDSCPNTQDSTITVEGNGISTQARLSVQMFQFVGDYSHVYLHCQISLCDVKAGSCAPSCSGSRMINSIAETRSYNLRVGPVTRDGSKSSGVTEIHSSWAFVPALLFLAMLL